MQTSKYANSLPFNKYKSNDYSQNGEDGVLTEILKRIYGTVPTSGTCVEFGAWDGIKFSNTFKLVKENEWNAIYIEGAPSRYEMLEVTAREYPRITPVNDFVARNKESGKSLDSILLKYKLDTAFELLSIDIDSYDLDIWESLTEFKPIIIVIEINSSVWPGIVLRDGQGIEGNSFSATITVAILKGYTCVCHTGNLIFVRNDFIHRLEFENRFVLYPELLFDPYWSNNFNPLPTKREQNVRRLKRFFLKIKYKCIKEVRKLFRWLRIYVNGLK